MDADIAALSAQLPGLTEDQVAQVMQAYQRLHSGPPVGTVVRDPKTGAIGHRVELRGVPCWAVSTPTGATWTDEQPTLDGWELVAGNDSEES